MEGELTIEQRSEILNITVQSYLSQGWRIQSRTEPEAQLILPAKKKMWPGKDQIVNISVDLQGKVHEQHVTA
jgi:hypothetical protein